MNEFHMQAQVGLSGAKQPPVKDNEPIVIPMVPWPWQIISFLLLL